MLIFWRLVLSHLLSDFTLQFDVVNRLKRDNMWGMLIHCATHFVVSAGLTWNYLGEVWFSVGGVEVNGWWALSLMFLVHYAIDELRVYSMKTWYRDNTVSFLMDQFLHLYVLFLISPASVKAYGGVMGEEWVVIASLLVLVTHFTTVLIYFLEKDMFGRAFPYFDEQYFLIFERVVLWAFFLVPGRWWLPFAAAWTLQIFYVRKKRILDISRLNVWLNVLSSVWFGAAARLMHYGRI